MQIIRTTSENKDFKYLVKKLDTYLKSMNNEDHSFYDEFNKIDMLKNCVVIFFENEAVSCGAIKEFDDRSVEIKRMFTLPEYRGKSFASSVLKELERWAKELKFSRTVLETGKKQIDAVALYEKCGYQTTPNYGQYSGIEDSVCF